MLELCVASPELSDTEAAFYVDEIWISRFVLEILSYTLRFSVYTLSCLNWAILYCSCTFETGTYNDNFGLCR